MFYFCHWKREWAVLKPDLRFLRVLYFVQGLREAARSVSDNYHVKMRRLCEPRARWQHSGAFTAWPGSRGQGQRVLLLFGSRETLNPTGFIRKRPVRAGWALGGCAGVAVGRAAGGDHTALTGRPDRKDIGSPREGEPRTLARASPPSHPCEDASCRGPQVPGPTEGPSTEWSARHF